MQKNCCDYPIEMTRGAFDADNQAFADLLREVTGAERPKVLLAADYNVVQHTEGLGSRIGRYMQENDIDLLGSPLVLSGGEKIKTDNLQSALKVVSAILSAKLGRDGCVVALGGGTVQDVVGYAASQTRGGVKLVRMPTTYASMAASTFATYAAVDSMSVKDAMRVPSIPSGVLVDTDFAFSVLDGVWRAGIGETVRLALAKDSSLFKKVAASAADFRQRDDEVMESLLGDTIKLAKKKGPTHMSEWIAARLEAMSSYKLPHGYAVAIGVCIDAKYAALAGHMKPADFESVRDVLSESGALDGAMHSRYLLARDDEIVFGLNAWELANGSPAIEVPAGIGKTVKVEEPDRELMQAAIRTAFLSTEPSE